MRKYKTFFSSFHTIYRLITTSANVTNFLVGACRIYKTALSADDVTIICKNINTHHRFIKICLTKNKERVQKGGISILNAREKEVFNKGKEIFDSDNLIYPFIFSEILGIVSIKRKTLKSPFNEFEKKWFLSICEEISIGLKIFDLLNETKKYMLNYIKSLTKLLNQFVPTSSIHPKSIFCLIKAIGKELHLTKEEIKSLEYASLLHDAGKMQLPSKILKKQKPLTDEEFKMIMEHPHKGVELIKDLEVLRPVIPIILHHHEKYDGTGYPDGLKKEQIPLGARILSVLDAFDAMFFGRPYRKRRYLIEIEEELKNQMGKQFDPKVVVALLKIIKRESIKKYLQSFL
ncbi:MAG: HD domain-containing protein [Candidatus Omnitrophica bacterium]|nr:HD domain-containing protein [Candidatus Omnitrophota bacterium]